VKRPDLIDTASTVLTVCGGAALAFALFGAAVCVVAGWVP
jgi:methylthioribose-1-phosphate isomerase